MLICRNAEEVHGQRNVGNSCLKLTLLLGLHFVINSEIFYNVQNVLLAGKLFKTMTRSVSK